MSSKATALAPANIAFVKYWGARDLARALPVNRSISMTLRECLTRTTVEHVGGEGVDEVFVRAADGLLAPATGEFSRRIVEHLERIRGIYGCGGRFRLATQNSFPAAAGLASSASGFAALSLAATGALGIPLEPLELSRLARQSGSGSAARSAFGGYVEWPAGFGVDEDHATPLDSAEGWELRDVIALVDLGEKPASSLEGHRRALTSPHYAARQNELAARLDTVREAIARRDLTALGPTIEEEAVELHLVAMSSRPPIFYWRPGTLTVLEAVRWLRGRGVGAWATMDAGPNVHVICSAADEERVARHLATLPEVRLVIRDGVGPGPRLAAEHLF
jgi:diphosphomevalonate decarboxylase